ncbi:MAG: cytochrome b/b6 domain-containing protein [Rhodobacteraceae bacterium]|nr:cytochrome b/b6 domain-containing protein [Paracoccaceae bacterium]
MKRPAGYTRTQIALHWLVFLLVAAQFLLHESIAEAWDKFQDGVAVEFSLLIASHVVGGILILVFGIWRIAIKIRRGAPALPDSEPRLQQIIGHATQGLLYLLLILMPVSGMVAWFGGVALAAQGHEVMRIVLLALVVLHILGALYHRIVLKSGVMERMLRPES